MNIKLKELSTKFHGLAWSRFNFLYLISDHNSTFLFHILFIETKLLTYNHNNDHIINEEFGIMLIFTILLEVQFHIQRYYIQFFY